MLADQSSQGPVQGGASDFLAWCHGLGQVLAPYVPTGMAAVAAVPDDQDSRSPTERRMADPAGHRIPWRTFGSAVSAPRIGGRDLAQDLRLGGGEVLADRREAEGVQAGESRQVRGAEDRMVHCRGLFRMVV